MMTTFEGLPALSPIQFFGLAWECAYFDGKFSPERKYRLPSTAQLLSEEEFATVFMGWNERKVALYIQSNGRTENDSLELFFDTRDLKTKAQVSKYCHHFLFTPEKKEGFFGREVSRFRDEDIHRLCNPEELLVNVEDGFFHMAIEIPATCLHGYDPIQFQRLGFTYRIRRMNRPAQHFAVSSEEFKIEQHPSLWATLELVPCNGSSGS
jgi:hypothetical protein